MSGDLGLVFIHGAGLGGWIWERLGESLHYPYLVADFPLRDAPVATRRSLTLDDYATHVAAQAGALRTDRVVIVAHSLGGAVALKAAALLADRLAGLVGVSATVPRNGGSFLSALPLPQRWIVGGLMRVVGTKPPESAIRHGLCSDLDDATADRVVASFAPESRAVYTDRTDARVPDVPRRYVVLTEDKEFAVGLQRTMAENLGATDIPELPAGHLAMLSQPAALAGLLNDFTAKLP